MWNPQIQKYELLGDHQVWVFLNERLINQICLKRDSWELEPWMYCVWITMTIEHNYLVTRQNEQDVSVCVF